MASPQPGPATRLEQLVRQLRRTNAEFRHDFENTSAQLGREVTVSERHAGRWMAGNLSGRPHPAACRVLEQMFGENAERLFGPAEPPARVEISTTAVIPETVWASRAPAENMTVQREIAMAATLTHYLPQPARLPHLRRVARAAKPGVRATGGPPTPE